MKKYYLVTYQKSNLDYKTEIVGSTERPRMIFEGGTISSLSPSYPTPEAIKEAYKILEEPCRECGSFVQANFRDNATIIANNLCFYCDLWNERSKRMTDQHLIIDGSFYTLGEESFKRNGGFRGFGGRKFIIEKDGKIFTSTNLWHGGIVPERFRSRLPNNAKFLRDNEM